MFGLNKLPKFYNSVLEFYSAKRKYGYSIIDSNALVIKNVFFLKSGFFHSNTLKILNELDIIDIIQFMIWFNTSHKDAYIQVPKGHMPDLSKVERKKIYDIAFKSGYWWNIKDDLRVMDLNLQQVSITLGDAINNDFKLN